MVLSMHNVENKTCDSNIKNYHVKYLKDYVYRCLRREKLSFYYRQLLSFNKSKFEDRYLLPLINLSSIIYKKKVEYNLVNLKYLYLNSHIYSETIITKLRKRKNRLLRILKTSLLMFKLPDMDRTAVYDEIYNRKKRLQNSKIRNVTSDAILSAHEENKVNGKNVSQFSSLDRYVSNPLLSVVNNTKLLNPDTTSYNYPLHITNNILKLIKNKYVSGIRLEVAGRLTRRNTAARSVFKLRYKGNIKNMDSSYKGLPSVLLRGYAKSNLQYTNLKSKIRIGSFGLKG